MEDNITDAGGVTAERDDIHSAGTACLPPSSAPGGGQAGKCGGLWQE